MTDQQNNERSTRLAQQLAQRLEADQDYLAYLISVLRTFEGFDDAGLANALGAPLDRLSRIALCRTPRDEMFKEDVDEIAEQFSLDPSRLARLVRHGQALSAFSGAYSGEMLAAARDRAAEERADYEAGHESNGESGGEEENAAGSEERGEDR